MRVARLFPLLALASLGLISPARSLASRAPPIAAAEAPKHVDASPSSGPGFVKQIYNLNASGTLSVGVGDVTGDGRDDALITVGTNSLHVNLLVLAQQPDGSLGPPVKYALNDDLSQPSERGIGIADLNGDHKNDVAVAVASPPGVEILYQSNGGLGSPVLVPTSDPARLVRVADMNNDGKQDLVVDTDGGVRLFTNTGSGFTESSVNSVRQFDIKVADLTGDGRLDILGSDVPQQQFLVNVFVQGIDGTFSEAQYMVQPSGSVTGLGAGDVTGDGLNDLLVSSYGTQHLFVLAQNPSGGFDAAMPYAEMEPAALTAFDFSGDGRQDLLSLDHYYSYLRIQQPDGSLGPPCAYTTGDGYPHTQALAVGDINSDGLTDFVTANPAFPPQLEVIRQVAHPSSSLSLQASPPSITVGQSVTLSGALTFPEGGCLGGLKIQVVRTNPDGSPTKLASVKTKEQGAFSFGDTPPTPGEYTYKVVWKGDQFHKSSSASAMVMVNKIISSLTLSSSPSSMPLGDSTTLSGTLQFSGPGDVGQKTIHLTRTNPDNSQTNLPDAITDSNGNYSATDSPQAIGTYSYQATWDGDQDHDGSTAMATLIVGSGAYADFNGDGFADLAVGVPGEDNSVGAINVIYGSTSGLVSAGNQILRPSAVGVPGPLPGDAFGFAVAPGDFNHDGFSDLAVGIPGKNNGAGAVSVVFGSPGGLTPSGAEYWNQDSPGILDQSEAGDQFGIQLASGDFNNDGFADVAVGVNTEDLGNIVDAGAVNVIYGSSSGLTATGNQFWNLNSPGIAGSAAAGDFFGNSVAAGDFNKDGFADLAVGISGKKLGNFTAAGAASVIYGSASGLTATGNQLWSQDSPGIADQNETGDNFGWSVAAGDLNGDGAADLVVGVRLEDVGNIVDAGAINVIYGSSGGLTAAGNQFWNENSPGIAGSSARSDQFGYSLASADMNRDGKADLGVGVPGKNLGSFVHAGAVNAIYGSASGLTSAGNQLWSQDSPGIPEQDESGDFFGWALYAADMGNGPQADLVVGVPGEDLNGQVDAGGVNAIYGSPAGLTSTGSQFWNQGSNGIQDQAEANDNFGFGLSPGSGKGARVR